MDLQTLLFEKDGGVGVVTLNRPRAMNTFNEDMWAEMEILQNAIEADGEIRAVVIKAAGDKFSAGIDISLLGKIDSYFVMKNLPRLQNIHNRWDNLRQPVIAAVQGICFGAATELILSCDIRVSADDGVFGMQEVNFGLSPDLGGTQRLTRVVGASQAKRLILACETIDAAEAQRIGLVDVVYPGQEMLARAMELAQKIASKPPVAVMFGKKAINLARESSLQAGLMYEQAQSIFCLGTEDKQEAVAAFFDKRKPVFKGR